jgi:hypothetical protein
MAGGSGPPRIRLGLALLDREFCLSAQLLLLVHGNRLLKLLIMMIGLQDTLLGESRITTDQILSPKVWSGERLRYRCKQFA